MHIIAMPVCLHVHVCVLVVCCVRTCTDCSDPTGRQCPHTLRVPHESGKSLQHGDERAGEDVVSTSGPVVPCGGARLCSKGNRVVIPDDRGNQFKPPLADNTDTQLVICTNRSPHNSLLLQ